MNLSSLCIITAFLQTATFVGADKKNALNNDIDHGSTVEKVKQLTKKGSKQQGKVKVKALVTANVTTELEDEVKETTTAPKVLGKFGKQENMIILNLFFLVTTTEGVTPQPKEDFSFNVRDQLRKHLLAAHPHANIHPVS